MSAGAAVWGWCSWSESRGTDLVPSDDLAAVRALQPGGKVLRLLGDEAGFVRLGYGAVTVRMRPSLFHVVDVLVHEPGDALVLADGRGAEVLDVHWHHQRAEPMYRLRVAGKVRSRRYWNADVRRPVPS